MDDCRNFHGGLTLRSLLENQDLLPIPTRGEFKEKEVDFTDSYSDMAAAAFLGPNLWEKTLSDFKLECLNDLFENNAAQNDMQPKFPAQQHLQNAEEMKLTQLISTHNNNTNGNGNFQNGYSCQMSKMCNESCEQDVQRVPQYPTSPMNQIVLPYGGIQSEENSGKREVVSPCSDFSMKDLALATPPGEDHFNPAEANFQEDDLKPQPITKKSLKHYVPDDLKDDKYWMRRRKNNLAAKRSREARRLKENQIVLRASYLEKENNTLKEDVLRLKAENDMLWRQLKKLKK